MKRYNPKELEPKWQKKWATDKLYHAIDFDQKRPKYTVLTEFPYPSGDGLHLGHVREYTLGDIMARHKRQQGFNVLYPMGYDAFGLPTENYAIKNKIAPQVATAQNVSNFQKQFESLGYSIDWERSVNTTDPDYYKWTQWLFLQFYKKGLAYQAEVAINWCPHCKTGLANEEVVNGRHERCDTLVEKKTLKQWLLAITKYADRLIDGLQDVDYPSRIADQQVNWIGRSKGAEVDFVVDGHKDNITVFTTRPDTLFGATFVVLAPEHPLVKQITTDDQRGHVNSYIKAAQGKSEIERQNTDREKTGVFTGAHVINPVNDEKIPVWIADYVLTGYGTGAIMAVPAHDQRDYEFAKKFDLPITYVIDPVAVRDDAKDKTTDKKKNKVVAVVQNDSGEMLTINWGPTMGGRLFVGGTVEKGEDPRETALREVTEETGYSDLEVVEVGPETFFYKYFAFSKQETHEVETTFVSLRLKSDKRVAQNLDESEKGNFAVEWVDQAMADREVVEPLHRYAFDKFILGFCYHAEGLMANSGTYNGLPSAEAREKIVADLAKKGHAKERINYRLRDWIFSRQHYWGEPIPIIHCPKDGAVAVPDKDLPVVLPKVEHYEPTDTGESPLAAITDWVNTTCPTCNGPAKRETDTMPNWAGSSWYYLRYYDAHNDQAFADRKKLDYWGAVDVYLGGMEHTTLHLLYSRFWHQFFYDQGLVPTPEPYTARRGQGIILAADGTKMSKSKGNIVNPNDILEQGYGADALRLTIAFLAPYDQTTPWSPESLGGTFRFLQRVWTLVQEYQASKAGNGPLNAGLRLSMHKTIKQVSQDLQAMGFNTPIAALMAFVNELYKIKAEDDFAAPNWKETLNTLLQLLAPFAPHMTEELWHQLGHKTTIHTSAWPVHDEKYLVADTVTIVVQVNGKVRAQLQLPPDAGEETVVAAAQKDEHAATYLKGKIRKTIYVPGKLVNFVV
jgi:leucyl-tRNA synthetase